MSCCQVRARSIVNPHASETTCSGTRITSASVRACTGRESEWPHANEFEGKEVKSRGREIGSSSFVGGPTSNG
jgi:hypothetical protein